MRALVQRVSEASVTIGGEVAGRIDRGLVVLLGISRDDTEVEARYIAGKVANLRIFSDDEGKFQSSALDVGADGVMIPKISSAGQARPPA